MTDSPHIYFNNKPELSKERTRLQNNFMLSHSELTINKCLLYIYIRKYLLRCFTFSIVLPLPKKIITFGMTNSYENLKFKNNWTKNTERY